MSDKKLMLKAVLFSSVCGILIAVIFTCLLAAVMTVAGVLPANVLNYCTAAVSALSALFAGFVGARITKSAGLIVGVLSGLGVFAAVTVAGLASGSQITLLLLGKLGACTAGGAIGGIMGVNKKERIKI